MNPVLYAAASGANQLLYSQQVTANNLSNADTTGFKAILERSSPVERFGDGFNTSTTSRTNSTAIMMAQGQLSHTGRALDLGIEGEGLFALEAPNGDEVYTRNGNVKVGANGELSINGMPLLSADGQPLVIDDYSTITVAKNGLISMVPVDGVGVVQVDTIKLVNPEDTQLVFNQNGYLEAEDGVPLPAAADGDVTVMSEHLEQSNVSTVEQMVKLMETNRQFEMQVKMMKAADSLMSSGNKLISS